MKNAYKKAVSFTTSNETIVNILAAIGIFQLTLWGFKIVEWAIR